MYIEMTSFAIPTFIITVAKLAAVAVFVWIAIVAIGLSIYKYGE